jgi:UDP-arabinose 4-epimerase
MHTILVTGGAGYIGSHTCKALAAAGYIPVTYDNLVYGHDWAVKWGPLEKGDILDPNRLSEVFAAHKPTAVIHFAAFAYVGESVTEPAKYYRNNLMGTLALLDAMRAHGTGQIVFSSTCATYGIPEAVPISEEAVQSPISPYGASKLMGERILRDYGAAYGLQSIALRYFNAAGADPEGELGEAHNPETHLIPLVLDVAAGIRSEVTVLGNDYDTPDGTCIRDYVHVSDIANAHVLALKKLGTGDIKAAYNLGTGIGISVAEVIEAARRVTGRDIPIARGCRRAGDADILLADATRAVRDLEWQPQHSTLEKMIETAWNWHLRDMQARRRASR